MYAHITELYEGSHTGMALGTVVGLAWLISALSPTLTGTLIDRYGYTVAFMSIAVIFGLGVLALGKGRNT